MEQPSETQTPRISEDIEESGESTKTATSQGMEQPSEPQTPKKSEDTEESGESTKTATSQGMEQPSEPQTRKKSEDTEESGESTGTTEIGESKDRPTINDIEKQSGTMANVKSQESGESTETQNQTDTEATEKSKGAQPLEAQTDVESAPLNSQTGALLPVESSSSYSLRWLWSCIASESQTWYSFLPSLSLSQWIPWPVIGSQASQTHEEEPGNKDDEDPGKGFDHDQSEGAAGNKDDEDPGDGSVHVKQSEGAAGNKDDEDGDGFELVEKPEAYPDYEPAGINGKSFKENIDKIGGIIESTRPTNLLYVPSYHKVGIFSRSSESDYEWLIIKLKSKPFQSIVSIVISHYISNNGREQFMDAVSQCTFGILYHTKNRGRINIVDVTDSLYDVELEYMSEHLGKKNVIVVVDDLEDASEEEKTRILKAQPSIEKLATDIFLFNANEKK